MEEEKYVPGLCNIGGDEIKRRWRFGWAGFVITVVFAGLAWYFNVNNMYRLLITAPVFMAAIGFLQANNRFCVKNGLLGKHVMQSGKTIYNEPGKYLQQDKKRSAELIIIALLIAVAASIIFYFLP